MPRPQKKSYVIPIVHLLLLKDGKILLLERMNTGRNDGYYGLVAGHKEAGEEASRAVIREAKEEVGIELQDSHLNFSYAMHRLNKDHTVEKIDLFFITYTWEGKITNMEPDKHGDPTWFPIDKLPDNTVPFIRAMITGFRQQKHFSEFIEGTI